MTDFTAGQRSLNYLTATLESLEREAANIHVRIDLVRTLRMNVETFRDEEAAALARAMKKHDADISAERSS